MTDNAPVHIPEVKAIHQTRRLLANARERTRVHTISAAFEALRKQVSVSMKSHTVKYIHAVHVLHRITCNVVL